MADAMDPEVREARTRAVKLREEAFEQALLTPKEERVPVPEEVAQLLGGIFQNCGQHYAVAAAWYSAATEAYKAGNASLGNVYTGRGDEAMDAGNTCTAWF